MPGAFFLCVFKCVLVSFGLCGLFNVLFMQVVINGHHGGRGSAFFFAVLFDDFHDFVVERCVVGFLLGGQVIEGLRKAGIFRFVPAGEFGIVFLIVNFRVDQLGQFLNNLRKITPPLQHGWPCFRWWVQCRRLPGRKCWNCRSI